MMHAIVLIEGKDELVCEMAEGVAKALKCRSMPFRLRPDLGLYELVVLATPYWGVTDPRLFSFAALELKSHAFALLTDAGPPGDVLFCGLTAVAMLAGANVQLAMHGSTGWLADTHGTTVSRAAAWGEQLALSYPPLTYPRGGAGKRVID